MSFEIDLLQKKLDEVWPGWKIAPVKLGHGSYGDVYEIYRSTPDNRNSEVKLTSALKVLRMETGEQDGDAFDQKTVRVARGRREESFSESAFSKEENSRTWRALDKDMELEDYWKQDLYFRHVSDSMVDEFVKTVGSEINMMIQLKGHPHIVSIEDYTVFREDDACMILIRMEKLNCLSKDLKRGKRLNQSEVIRLGMDICEALTVCERENIIHRDIKPSNIFYGNENCYKLGDFGISRTMESIYERASMSSLGTMDYIAPEVFRGEAYNNTSDLYSLGMVLYEAVNGSIPMPGNAESKREAFRRRMRGEKFALPAGVDIRLGQVICRACAYSPEERYSNAAEFYEALEGCLEAKEADDTEGGRKKTIFDRLPANLPLILEIIAACLVVGIIVVLRIPFNTGSSKTPSLVNYTIAFMDDHKNLLKEESYEGSVGEIINYTAPELEGYELEDATGKITLSENADENRLEFIYLKSDSVDEEETEEAQEEEKSVIEWSDEKLREAVCRFLNRTGDMTYEEAAQVKTLECMSAGITNIESLQYFSNLEKLDLSNNEISDLSPVSRLAHLKALNVEMNRVSDLSPLSEMTWLKRLDLKDNLISSLTPLEKLVNLEMLDFRKNHVSDLSPLRNMIQMKELFAGTNRIQEITPIAGMTKLTYLTISYNSEIEDISVLKDMTDLRVLTLTDDKVTDISVIRNMKKLYHLKIKGNPVKDKSPLEDLPEGCQVEE